MSMQVSNFCGQSLNQMPSIGEDEITIHHVPRIVATSTSLDGYGHIVDDFDKAEVTIVPWPAQGWRSIVAGTGNEGGVVKDAFEMTREGSILYATNHAVNRRYLTGWYGNPSTATATKPPEDSNLILTHEANYHPDGGQIFFPRSGEPFVALLALPGDYIRPEDFVAFYCDGSFGIHINPGVWHQPLFPIRDTLTFDNKQGRVHACISVDFVQEFGRYLGVSLANN